MKRRRANCAVLTLRVSAVIVESSAEKEEEQKQPIGCVIYFASLPSALFFFSTFLLQEQSWVSAFLMCLSAFVCSRWRLGVLSSLFLRRSVHCFHVCAHAYTHTHTCQEVCLTAVCFAQIPGRDILQGQLHDEKRRLLLLWLPLLFLRLLSSSFILFSAYFER